MSALTINDLEINRAMDQNAMIALTGGRRLYARFTHKHVKRHIHRRRNGYDIHTHVRRHTHRVRVPHIHGYW